MALIPPWGSEGHVASRRGFGQNRVMRVVRSLLVCGALAATLLVAPPVLTSSSTSSAQAKPADSLTMPRTCRDSYNVAAYRGFDVSRVADQRIVEFDGRRVTLDRKGWPADNSKDPSWTLWFHSLAWIVPLALDDSETAIRVFMERDRFLPDPGASMGNRLRRPMGWTQGQYRNRLETVTCLYHLTRDPRLVPIAKQLAAANMDPARYPGPPNYPVHNHGSMSNIALMQASKAFGVEEWGDVALKRFRRDLPYVFESCGMMREQSSTYQQHNLRLWNKVAHGLGLDLTRQERALGALVRPDGVLEAVGDGQPSSGLAPNGESLWCRETGWAAGTVEGAHFTLRFGPAVDYHGHQDHGGITWFAQGTPVLSDRGLFSKDRGSRYDFAHSMAAHSVFEPVGSPRYDPVSRADRLSGTEFEVSDAEAGITRTREIKVGPTRLLVRDRGTGAKDWIQHWQLAPGWEPTATGAVNEAAGLALTIDCPKLKPVRVEAFTAWRTAVDAWDMQCRVPGDRDGARITTTLTVAPTSPGEPSS